MTIEVFEAFDSGDLSIARAAGQDATGLRYFVKGTEDRDEAAAEVLSSIPFTQRSLLIPKTLKLKRLESVGAWEAELQYADPDKTDKPKQMPRAVGEATWSFDATGATQRVFEAFSQTAYGTGAPDADNQINIRDGKVEGVDIIIPSLTITINQKFEGGSLTLSWAKAVADMVGTTNDATFIDEFDAGEMLFLGAQGTQPVAYNDDGSTAFGPRDVTFNFAYSKNRTGLSFGAITGVAKNGHQYVWFAYEVVENADSLKGGLVGVYVATVYEESDFDTLGIVNPDDYPAGV